MEEIEGSALSTSYVASKVWKRYLDDSFSIIKINEIQALHNKRNSLDTQISFNIEHKKNGQIPFLDT